LIELDGSSNQQNAEGFWEANIRTLKRKRGETQKYRVVPLHDKAVAVIGVPAAPGPIMGNTTRYAFESAFKKAVRRLGFPRTRIHDLRHTWATRYMEKTGDLYGLMRLGGWKDLKSVDKYQHLTKGRSNAILSLDFGF
ncbi:MAG: tyrosine-type recombinase/integrase, partial [Elusimicrobia bacterium]|nr:tyrosine-type recombinase/integrase [Elusimicrobiota bacterium]